MATVNNIKELELLVNQKIKVAMEQEVKKAAVKSMQEHVVTDIYDQYSPTQYQRTGGLASDKNIKGTMINDNTLEIENVRRDEKSGRYIAPVIESGTGYQWKNSEIYQMQPFPRPFVENTAKDLENGLAKKSLAEGLKKQGLDVT